MADVALRDRGIDPVSTTRIMHAINELRYIRQPKSTATVNKTG